MRALSLLATISFFLTVCASCGRHSRVARKAVLAPKPALTFQSDSKLCSEATTEGDTLRAHLISGGESIVPRSDSGSPARFVVRGVRTALLGDTASHPLFDLELVSLGDKMPPTALRHANVGVEYRVRSDSVSGRWYICVLPISKIFVGAM